MVGSPQILIQGVDVKTKLNASILPGDTVDIQAETRQFAFSGVYEYQMERDLTAGNGLYSVLGVKHEGDFYGDTWDTSVSGVRKT